MMTVMTTKNDDDDDVHRLSVGRTLLLLVAGLLLHCLANLGKNLNIFPLLLSPHPDDFRIFFMTMKISTSVLILKILVFWICHNHENIDLLRQVLDHSGALWHAVSGTSLLRHHVICQLGIINITGLTISARMLFCFTEVSSLHIFPNISLWHPNLAVRDRVMICPRITVSSPMSISIAVPDEYHFGISM